MNNIINITFLEEALDVHAIEIWANQGGFLTGPRFEDFVFTPRVSSGQIQVYNPAGGGASPYTGIVGEYTANLFKQFFEMDYNAGGLITCTVFQNIVTLTIGSRYFWLDPDASSGITGASENLNITWTFGEAATGLTLVDLEYEADVVEPCAFVKMNVEASGLIDTVVLNSVLINTNLNSTLFSRLITRGQPFKFQFTDYSANIMRVPTFGTSGFYLLDPANINISVVPTGGGVTVSFIYSYVPINGFVDPILEWSLDGVTYQTSNIFTGQAAGAYTIYMRDQFNCVNTLEYSILDYGARNSYEYISKANSINYVRQEEVDNCSTFRNQDNSFNYQSLSLIKYCENILLTTCDKITTQVKSNYSDLTVTLRKDGEADVNIVPVKRSLNLDRFQSMDCMVYNYGNGLTGIYFDSGNTYDELGTPIGTYILNGNLPTLAMIGNIINIDNGYGSFIIEDVIFDDNIQKNVIIITNEFDGAEESVIISSTFDLLEFEVFEFDVDWSVYGVGLYDVVVLFEDENYDDVVYISENICVKEEQKDTVAIRYYNNNNKDIFYKYGIENFIRIPLLDIQLGVKDESEINIGDYTSELVSSSLNLMDKYKFDELPDNIRLKLIIALASKNLFINNIGYIKETNVSIEPVENTNLAIVEQTLIRTNINYNISLNKITIGEGLTANFPNLITDGNDFIKQS